MTRQQRFEKMVAQYWTSVQNSDRANYDRALCALGHYVAQNAHLIAIKSGNGVQEAMRQRGAR